MRKLSIAIALVLYMCLSYYSALSEEPRIILQSGHKTEVKTVKYSSDGKYIVSGGADGSVKLWDAASGQLLKNLGATLGAVGSAEFSPRGERVIAASELGGARVWEIESGAISAQNFHNRAVTSAAFYPDNRLAASADVDGAIKIWDLQYPDSAIFPSPFNLPGSSAITAMDISAGGELIVAARANGGIFFIDGKLTKSSGIWISELRNIRISDVKIDAEAGRLFARYDDAGLYIYKFFDIFSGAPLAAVDSVSCRSEKFALSPDGKKLAVSCVDYPMKASIYDVERKMIVAELESAPSSISSMDFSPDGKRLCAGLDNGEIVVWDLMKQRIEKKIQGEKSPVADAEFSPTDRVLVSAAGKYAYVWDFDSGEKPDIYDSGLYRIFDVAFSPNGKNLYISGESAKESFAVLDIYQRKIRNVNLGERKVIKADVSPDGKKVAIMSAKAIKVFDAETWSLLNEIEINASELKFSTLGDIIAIGQKNGSVIFWRFEEIQKEKQIQDAIELHSRKVNKIIFLNHHTILTCSDDAYMKRFNLISRDIDSDRSAHNNEKIFSATPSPGSDIVASAGNSGDIAFHQIREDKLAVSEARIERAHENAIVNVSYSFDRQLLASASVDGTIKLWKADGKPYAFLFGKGERDWAIVRRDSKYDGSPGAFERLHWTQGLKTANLNTYAENFSSGLMTSIFEIESESKFYPDGAAIAGLPYQPEIRVISHNSFDTVDAENTRLTFTAKAGERKLSEVIIKINGKTTNNFQAYVESNQVGQFNEIIPLFIGENNIEIIFKNEAGEYLFPQRFTLFRPGNIPDLSKRTLYLISIGISDYRGSSMDLYYADRDAAAFDKFVVEANKPIGRNIVRKLYINKEARKELLKKALDSVRDNCRKEDTFVFFYAGHGIIKNIGDGDEFLFPLANYSESNDANIEQTTLSASELAEYLKNTASDEQIVIIDACHSSAASAQIFHRKKRNKMEKLQFESGFFGLFSSSPDKRSYELHDLKHGLFTYVLLEAARNNPSGKTLTAADLKNYVLDNWKKISGEFQIPAQTPNYLPSASGGAIIGASP